MLRAESLVQLEDYEEWLRKKVASVGDDESDTEGDSNGSHRIAAHWWCLGVCSGFGRVNSCRSCCAVVKRRIASADFQNCDRAWFSAQEFSGLTHIFTGASWPLCELLIC